MQCVHHFQTCLEIICSQSDNSAMSPKFESFQQFQYKIILHCVALATSKWRYLYQVSANAIKMSIRYLFGLLGQSDEVDKDVSDGNGDNNDEDDEKIIADIRVWTSWLERTIQTAEGINGQQVVLKQYRNFDRYRNFQLKNEGIFH